MSQPTLSSQIRKLEDELGVTLLERTNKRVDITPVGSQILVHAQRALAEAGQMEAVARAARDPLKGPLKLGVIPTLAPYLMPLILRPLRQAYPELTIELWEDQTRLLIDGLRNHRLDAALLATAARCAGDYRDCAFRGAPAGRAASRPSARGSRNQSAKRRSPTNCWCWLTGTAWPIRRWPPAERRTERLGAGCRGSMQAATLETLVNLVAAGYGATLIPALAADSLAARDIILRPLTGQSSQNHSLGEQAGISASSGAARAGKGDSESGESALWPWAARAGTLGCAKDEHNSLINRIFAAHSERISQKSEFRPPLSTKTRFSAVDPALQAP